MSKSTVGIVSFFAFALISCGGIVDPSITGEDQTAQLDGELRGPACGSGRCPANKVCCNSSCGICTEAGGACTQEYCAPSKNTCTVTGLCIEGYSWSSTRCACVADKKSNTGSCTTDADCRTFSDYCTGCDCRALSVTDKDPTCSGPGVRCFADPCMSSTAVCVNSVCTLATTTN